MMDLACTDDKKGRVIEYEDLEISIWMKLES